MSQRTVFKGGTVVDGTGAPPSAEDILIEGDRIVAREPDLTAAEGTEVRQINGLTLTPGFIDLHSHADFTLLAFPSADSAIRQGITTVATGNCGGGVAPIRRVSDVGTVAFAYDPDWEVDVDWSSFGEYTERLHRTAINVAPLVPHGTIRNAVIGMDPRPSTPSERRAMRTLLADCLDDGAFGMSTGLEYQPGIWTDEEEVEELVAEVGSRGRLYATHMRGRAEEHASATAEALNATKASGARLQLSHFAPRPNAPTTSSETAFHLVAEAVSNGETVGVDTFPEIWGPALLIDLFPSWVLEGSHDDVLARLSSEDTRRAIGQHFEWTPSFLARVAGYQEIYVADTPTESEIRGMSLTSLAAAIGESVSEACCDTLLEAGEEYRSVGIRHIYATEKDLRKTLSLPYCSIESDGVITSGEGAQCPLVWNASSHGYVPRVLEHYVREEKFLSIEEAVRRMTSLPASVLGLSGRGSITVGSYADLVVLNSDAIHDRSTPNDPARHPTGIELVLVNGKPAVEQGSATGSRSGRLLTP